MAPAAVRPREAILSALRGKEYRPMDLLIALGSQGYTDSEIKQAVAELLHEGVIALTSQRRLKSLSEDAA